MKKGLSAGQGVSGTGKGFDRDFEFKTVIDKEYARI